RAGERQGYPVVRRQPRAGHARERDQPVARAVGDVTGDGERVDRAVSAGDGSARGCTRELDGRDDQITRGHAARPPDRHIPGGVRGRRGVGRYLVDVPGWTASSRGDRLVRRGGLPAGIGDGNGHLIGAGRGVGVPGRRTRLRPNRGAVAEIECVAGDGGTARGGGGGVRRHCERRRPGTGGDRQPGGRRLTNGEVLAGG